MTKAQRLIKELTNKVNDLEQMCKNKESFLRSAQDECKALRDELDNLHFTFDLLSVPRRRKGSYSDLSANARFTLFMAQINNMPVIQPAEDM